MLKMLNLNIPLVESLEHISGYAKLKKDLVKNKRVVCTKVVGGLPNYCAITSCSLVKKECLPSAFKIPCTIGSSNFA